MIAFPYKRESIILMDKLYLPRCPLLDKIESQHDKSVTLDKPHLCMRCFYAQLGCHRLYGWRRVYESLLEQYRQTPDAVLLARQTTALYGDRPDLPTLDALASRPRRINPPPPEGKVRTGRHNRRRY